MSLLMVALGPLWLTLSMTSGYSVPCSSHSHLAGLISYSIFVASSWKMSMKVLPMTFCFPHPAQHLGRLVLAEAAVVDEYRVERVADGACHEHGRDGAVDAAAHGADDVIGQSHPRAHLLNEFVGVVGHDPILPGPALLSISPTLLIMSRSSTS